MLYSNNISIVTEENCFGCGSCYNCCPESAIEMNENSEMFLMPYIDDGKCTNCGLCAISCPALTDDIQKDNKVSQIYIGWSKDKKTRDESSSGGAFTTFSNWIFEQNGFVCGAALDTKAQLRHLIIESKKDLHLLRGSKYIQSDIGGTFRQIKKKLEDGQNGLFCGTPCQVAGLYMYLQKDYKNLFTLDLVCHGVPSQYSFNEFLEESFEADASFKNINFRDKRNGYYRPSVVFSFNANKQDCIFDFLDVDYMRGFSHNLYLRKSCGTCRFAQKKRVGDITLADLWTVKEKFPSLNYENGISTMLINNAKGEYLVNKVLCDFDNLKSVSYNDVLQDCLRKPVSTHPNRKLFFSLKEVPFSEKVDRCLVSRKNVGILNFHDDNANYGALFVAFSMKKAVEKIGYSANTINFIRNKTQEVNDVFIEFRNKYLNLTEPCYNVNELEKLNSSLHTFLTGGDQVFIGFKPIYCLNWVTGNKTIASYAASLGPLNTSYYKGNQRRIYSLLSRFDRISVREHSAVSILRDIGIHTECHIDSVLLLSENEYTSIIRDDENVTIRKEKYIACVLWDFDEVKGLSIYEDLFDEYKFIDVIHNNNGDFVSFGQFLGSIKHADYVISNSFHGIAFSIVFQKQFIAIRLGDMRDDRVISLFGKLEIPLDRFCYSIEDVEKNIFYEHIDYSRVNRNLAEERRKGLTYLAEVLEMKPTAKFDNAYAFSANKLSVRLINKISILKVRNTSKELKCRFLGKITLFSLQRESGIVYLFGVIPLFKVVNY